MEALYIQRPVAPAVRVELAQYDPPLLRSAADIEPDGPNARLPPAILSTLPLIVSADPDTALGVLMW